MFLSVSLLARMTKPRCQPSPSSSELGSPPPHGPKESLQNSSAGVRSKEWEIHPLNQCPDPMAHVMGPC